VTGVAGIPFSVAAVQLKPPSSTTPAEINTGSGATFRQLQLFVAVMTVGWALFAWIWRLPAPAFDDTLEAWSWGQHFPLGTYKHPPLTAWVAGIWFRVLPHHDWATYLLASLMVGIGLFGVAALVRRLVPADVADAAALAAVAIAMMTPFHTVMASNFNANIILLALWPWTAYAFCRLLERPGSIRAGILFGALAALGMLAKYATALLLIGCGIAALVHPNLRQVLRRPAAFVAIVVGCVMLAPHVVWLVQNDFPPFSYALEKTGKDAGRFIWKAATTGLGGIGLVLPMVLAWRYAAGPEAWSRLGAGLARLTAPDRRWLIPLALGPFVLTIAVGMTGRYKIATNFLIPTVCLLPVLIIVCLRPPFPARLLAKAAAAYLVVAVAVAPIVAVVSARANAKRAVEPTAAAARAATAAWREAFGQPVRIVAGTEMYELAVTFYSPDDPIEFTHFDPTHAPWITPERIARDGLLVICRRGDAACLAKGELYVRPGTVRWPLKIEPRLLGFKMPSVEVDLIMIPPAGHGRSGGG
jgi:4-amino-4-deoxy-L-arabinose transferase-like glycosyltransferase